MPCLIKFPFPLRIQKSLIFYLFIYLLERDWLTKSTCMELYHIWYGLISRVLLAGPITQIDMLGLRQNWSQTLHRHKNVGSSWSRESSYVRTCLILFHHLNWGCISCLLILTFLFLTLCICSSFSFSFYLSLSVSLFLNKVGKSIISNLFF